MSDIPMESLRMEHSMVHLPEQLDAGHGGGIVKKRIAGACMAGIMCMGCVVSANGVSAEEFKESGTIWVVGDSISSDHNDEDNLTQNEEPITGWGNVLQNYLGDKVTIQNRAKSGRSSKSYIKESVYKEVQKGLQSGDYMIVQFGHNDEDDTPKLHTDAETSSDTEESFKWYLKTYYIEPNIEKGVKTILASNVVRYTYENGEMGDQTNEPYAVAMKELAQEYGEKGDDVYYIDTFGLTKNLYEQLGEEQSAKLHARIGLGDAATMDKTHYSPYGAMYIGNMIAKELKGLGLECCQDAKSAKIADAQAAKEAKADKFNWK